MKEIAIIYRDRENYPAIQYIENNIYAVLGEYINITNYYVNEMEPNEIIRADAFLVCYEEMLSSLVGHIHDFSKVIVITRSILKTNLQPIIDIPKDSEVLVVNDSKASTLQTIYMFYELGIGHVSLIPYEKNAAKLGLYNNINYAIHSDGIENLVPPHIKNVYNFHNREVSFETFQKLITLLKLDNPTVKRNLIEKVDREMDTGVNFSDSYLSNFLKDQMLTDVVDESSMAILLVDRSNLVHYINDQGFNLFSLCSGDYFVQENYIPLHLVNKNSYKNEIVTINDDNYLIEKNSVFLFDEILGFYLVLQSEKNLRDTEINLNKQLKSTGFYAKHTFEDIVHSSESMHECIRLAKQISHSDYTVLLRGESGTGKELFAQSIHNFSPRSSFPFVAVNCAALPENLLESELFGYEAGAFTGAQKKGKIGLFEHAQNGTIFLDEIGDISPSLQSALLRVLQEKQIIRIGSDRVIDINVRVIAATNAALEQKVADGTFRKDLFYRLNVLSVNISPLRERKDDILPLMEFFLGKSFKLLTKNEKNSLIAYDWPGNIRELENAASYYHIIGKLPNNICQNHSLTFPEKNNVLPENGSDSNNDISSDALCLEILKIMAEKRNSISNIGRRTIQKGLEDKRIFVGEGIIKKHMYHLKEKGLINIRCGRAGSEITEEGMSFLSENDKQY